MGLITASGKELMGALVGIRTGVLPNDKGNYKIKKEELHYLSCGWLFRFPSIQEWFSSHP